MAMTLVSTVTVGSGGAAEITFDSIPQSAKDLFILVSGRSTNASFNQFALYFNTYGTGTYSERNLSGNGSSPSSGTNSAGTGQAAIGFSNSTSYTANTFSNHAVYIPNYAGSTAKSLSIDAVNENNATTADQAILAGLWSGTAAITRVGIFVNGAGGTNAIAQHTTASLYIIS